MRSCYLLFGVTFLVLIGFVSHAAAETRRLTCTVSSSFTDGVETNIDSNGDGVSATLGQGVARCNGSSGIFQEEVEWIDSALTNCPIKPGIFELHISPANNGQQRSVTTDLQTGDQTFGKITSATLCFDSSVEVATITGKGQYIGGTGRYAGATGSFTFQGSASYLMYGFKNGVFGGFGSYTGTLDATLILPDGNS